VSPSRLLRCMTLFWGLILANSLATVHSKVFWLEDRGEDSAGAEVWDGKGGWGGTGNAYSAENHTVRL
jgi:hypothetical protein